MGVKWHLIVDNFGFLYYDVFATVKNAAMNVGVQISLRDPGFISFGYIPKVDLLDLFSIFQGSSILFSTVTAP